MFGRTKYKNINNIEWTLYPPQEKPAIGKVFDFEVELKPSDDGFFRYIALELVNERTDKRAPMDRLTSKSRYLFKYNVDAKISSQEESKHKFQVRIPIHKEPSRNDKFICIKWQLSAQLILSKNEEESDLLGTKVAVMDLEVI
jgi:CRISPR/Cas system-associated protein Cas5 (RAMP superfamily)